MIKYKNDLKALEDIQNGSICVKTDSGGIRNMKYRNDYKENLVLVMNFTPEPFSSAVEKNPFIIKQREFCRYTDIFIIPKMQED